MTNTWKGISYYLVQINTSAKSQTFFRRSCYLNECLRCKQDNYEQIARNIICLCQKFIKNFLKEDEPQIFESDKHLSILTLEVKLFKTMLSFTVNEEIDTFGEKTYDTYVMY